MDAELRDERVYLEERGDERLSREAKAHGLTRRDFVRVAGFGSVAAWIAACTAPPPAASLAPSAAAVTATPGLSPSPAAAASPSPLPVVKAVPPDLFVNFGSNFEMRWENMFGRGYLVPNELFFVRDHSTTPKIDTATWRLKVDGSGVERPLELTYEQLLAMPAVSVTRFLECAGNGRSFFETIGGKKASGTQWKLGAIGVAEWTGVPLGAVLERAGLKRTARDVMPEGLDTLKVRRPLSVAKALESDTLLVFAMNGQPLPPDHGAPVRLLVPGWIGIASIKWVGRIEVSEQPLLSPWNTDTYVLIGPDYKPVGAAKGPVLTEQAVKSALELPWPAQIKAGRQLLRGRSWSGGGKIAKVDYSLDGGKTYQPVRLREPNIERAWVRWDFEWEASPGTYGIRLRATDDRGNTQPERVPFNEQGYLYGAVVSHPVTVT